MAHHTISIHVLRVEDDWSEDEFRSEFGISIHVLRVEDDFKVAFRLAYKNDFNPRPPCGGRPPTGGYSALFCNISIHVLRVEDDPTKAARPKQS